MPTFSTPPAVSYVLAVSTSLGGIPKHPLSASYVSKSGLAGDGHSHAKHIREDRAVSLFDQETLLQLVEEGFPLVPGAVGENLTVTGLQVQTMNPGTFLRIGEVVLRLEQPRKPCYVLDTIDPRLKEVIVGRCGYMASVFHDGWIRPGMIVEVDSAGFGVTDSAPLLAAEVNNLQRL